MLVHRGPRLALRAFSEADAPFLLRLFNDPGFVANIHAKGIRTVEAARTWVTSTLHPAYARDGFGFWAIVPNGADEPVGLCGLARRDWLPHVDLGYALVADATGKGWARDAARATVELAHERYGLARLLAIVDPGNARSIHLLASLGFRREGTARVPGETADVEVFGRDL